MLSINIKQFLEAGVHFGHQTEHWHPKMKPYIFSQRSSIHVIDLQKTMKKFKEGYEFVKNLSANGGKILFVGTKKQAQEIIKEEAARCGSFYVKSRWLGGMLTNFRTIRKNVDRLVEIENMEKEGMFEVLPQKEVKSLKKEKDKLFITLEGVREMEKLPDAVFVVDLRKEAIAIAEANKLGIPVIGIVDTNCDPNLVTHCIPGNDDAIRGIKLFVSQIANAVMEGKNMRKKEDNVIPVQEEAIEPSVPAGPEDKSSSVPEVSIQGENTGAVAESLEGSVEQETSQEKESASESEGERNE